MNYSIVLRRVEEGRTGIQRKMDRAYSVVLRRFEEGRTGIQRKMDSAYSVVLKGFERRGRDTKEDFNHHIYRRLNMISWKNSK